MGSARWRCWPTEAAPSRAPMTIHCGWDLETGARLAEFTADAAISCGALARDDLIVAGSQDGRIHILEIREP